MANTAVVQVATPNRLVFLLTGDGTVIGPTVTNATILAALVSGPLYDAFNATYANQAAMRLALLAGGPGTSGTQGCKFTITMITTVADTTAQINQPSVDVDTDAVSTTKPEINITMSDTTGTSGYLVVEHIWQPCL